MSPFAAYLELRELQAELAALSPDRDPFEAPKYDHDNPGVLFMELDRKIRPLLKGDVQKRFLQAPFTREGATLNLALTEEYLTQPSGYLIGVRTKMDPTTLAKLVDRAFDGLPEKADLMPVADIVPQSLGEREVIPLHVPQTVVLYGGVGLMRNDPDFIPAYVLNHILGGGSFDSRLFEEVRVKRGLSYSVSSTLAALNEAAVRLFACSLSGGIMRTHVERPPHAFTRRTRPRRRLGGERDGSGELERAGRVAQRSWGRIAPDPG